MSQLETSSPLFANKSLKLSEQTLQTDLSYANQIGTGPSLTSNTLLKMNQSTLVSSFQSAEACTWVTKNLKGIYI